ncbi:MAG: PVC-type heme-binding CxxCH protein [Planctomycetales bacterium]|jgi:putative membrane-bound dehydrogenase-like protein
MTRDRRIFVVAALLLIPSVNALAEPSSSISTERGTIRVPDGFTIERVAAAPLVKHPMLANFDERGRLFIAASAGKNLRTAELETELPNFVRMLEDTDDDGTFDKSTIFADKMTLPMGALPYRGSVYVAAPPNIWRLQDTDDDGVADKREILVGKFGYSGNAASIHGPFLSPTGRIFWCDGRHGHEIRDDVGAVTSQKRGSGIFSMRPDGSDIRMFCGGGMDNPVEVDFLRTGEVVGSVNILYTKPRVDCLVHWQDGGVYPHQEASIAEFKRTGDLLGPMTKFGHVAVSGMCRYRSKALGEDYQDSLFTTIFNSGKVIMSKVERFGGTFKTKETEFLSSDDPDFHPTDILEDADGSLLLIDTGGWFRIGCPTSQIAKPDIAGGIYRIRRAGSNTPAKRIRDPRGRDLVLSELAIDKLITLLDDKRPAVVERVIEEVSTRTGSDEVFARLFDNSDIDREGVSDITEIAQINLVWALSRRMNSVRTGILTSLIGHKAYLPKSPIAFVSDNVRIAAATALADRFDDASSEVFWDKSDAMYYVMVDKSAAVRRSLARLIGVACEWHQQNHDNELFVIRDAYPSHLLFGGLEIGKRSSEAERNDRQTEHAIILAAIRMADKEGTLGLLADPSPIVRRVALITLDQMEGENLSRESVVALLDTDDEPLRNAALDVISQHDGWASGTLSLLGGWLHAGHLPPERTSMIRGFLRTQTSDESIQKLVADLLLHGKLPQASRLLLLEVVAESGLPALPASWEMRLPANFASPYPAVRHQAVRTAAAFDTAAFDNDLLELANDDQQAVELRIDALAGSAERRSEIDDQELAFLLNQMEEEAAPLVKLAAARTVVRLPLSESQRLRIAQQLGMAGPLTVGVLLQEFSSDLNSELTRRVLKSLNALPEGVRLPKPELLAFFENTPEPLRADVQKFVSSRLQTSNETVLQKRESALVAGNAERGREIFLGKATACASCHTIAGQGGKVGPDLTKIGAIRKKRDLLEAIMFPSASFARGYKTWTIVTDRGRVHSGLITRETTDSLVLRKSDLSEVRISRGSIEEMREATTSVMPEGLYHRLANQDLSDLLEYLSSLK